MKKIYKIFPSIGIARVGNSESSYFIGPEAPGVEPSAPYRDAEGKIKRQGARFRIYEFVVDEFGGETVSREVTYDTNAEITWTVHLVNGKAAGKKFPPLTSQERNHGYKRDGLIIDAGSKDIAGPNKNLGPLTGDISFVQNSRTEASKMVKLGDLKTDPDGRLIVLGGHGCSRSPLENELSNFANNDGWYDDVSDGPVTAKVKLGDQRLDATPAWVVVAPPAFAPAIYNITTWYDQAVSVNADAFNPGLKLQRPSFAHDIYPILKRTVYLKWVSENARRGHGSGSSEDFLKKDTLAQLCDKSEAAKEARQDVFKHLVDPDQLSPHAEQNMPFLHSGINPANPTTKKPASLTRYQYFLMKKWKDGNFHSDWKGSEPASPIFEKIPVEEQPDALTRAALESCIGGPFFPGIETTYLMAISDTYSSPFRIDSNKPPGYLTELMALPWQADFRDCGALWWPAQRPVKVKVNDSFIDYSRGINSYAQMVQYWSNLGFIIQENNEYVESERQDIPSS